MENRVDHANPYTNQIFQGAVIRNDFAIVKLLLKYGIYPKRNERNRQGLTALQQSILDGHGRMAILLLEAAADIEARTSNGWTCLHIASALGDLDISTTLIKHCADLIALTKNEELPIDLAATREIKIKLAKEMSRVGYSELAQWYMRKLAAREGVFYMLSTDTLLDLACDDNHDKSYSNGYPYYIRQDADEADVFIQPTNCQPSNSAHWQNQDGENRHVANPDETDIWLEYPQQEKMTYLSCASGYLSEVVFDQASGEYTKVRKSLALSVSSGGSPQRKILESGTSAIERGDKTEEHQPRRGTLKRSASSKRSSQQNMQRNGSTIELHIDYSNTMEGSDDESNENIIEMLEVDLSEARLQDQTQQNTDRNESQEYRDADHSGQYYPQPDIQTNCPAESEFLDDNDSKNRNVRFNNLDNANEFCNCPNCKKMGYAFSPDIRSSARKIIHLGEPVIISPNKPAPPEFQLQNTYAIMHPNAYMHPQYCPPTTTEKHAAYYGQDYQYKPRKRKKKLFAGIKSMFKDSIKVHRTNIEDSSPMVEDAGILFAVSLRDRNKAKTIRQRQVVRKSNSFSGSRSDYLPGEVDIYPHDHVVTPPVPFSDSYKPNNDVFYDENSQPSTAPNLFMHSAPSRFHDKHSIEDNPPSRSFTENSPEYFPAQQQDLLFDKSTCGDIFDDRYYRYVPNNHTFDSQSVMNDARINTVMSRHETRGHHEQEDDHFCAPQSHQNFSNEEFNGSSI